MAEPLHAMVVAGFRQIYFKEWKVIRAGFGRNNIATINGADPRPLCDDCGNGASDLPSPTCFRYRGGSTAGCRDDRFSLPLTRMFSD
jgi:hypothetical protein